MNLAFFARFSSARKTNKILQMINAIKKHVVFKGARVDVYTPTLAPERIIVLLGQVHTVWKGKIGNRERNKIVGCQARLCSYYAFFEKLYEVKRFGGEGIYEGLDTTFSDQLSFQLYEQVEKKLGINKKVSLEQIPEVAEKILSDIGELWHDEVRAQANMEKVQLYAAAVSGQTLFNFLTPEKIQVFPVEGEKSYQNVLKGITHLGDRIQKLEQSYEMRAIQQRGGKVKDEKELEVLKQYNSLVKEFNKVIGSDIRERATMEIMRDKADKEGVVVFTMGIGHRKNYLGLMNEYLKHTKTAFVFVTAPELRINLWLAIGLPLLVLAILIGLGYFL